MTRNRFGRKTVTTVAVLVAVGAAGMLTPPASANHLQASVACHHGSAWANDPPRIIGWPWLMQRTPGYDTGYVYGGDGATYGYGTTSTYYATYTEQWRYFRVWANGVAGVWMAGSSDIGAGASPLNSWIEVQPGTWRQSVMFHWAGSGPEDYSFVRLGSLGGTYDVWVEFWWGPIYRKETNQLAYAGYHQFVYKGRIPC